MPKILKILLVLTFFKGLIWAYLIPPFQSPDEQNHFAYVQAFAETGQRPEIMLGKSVSYELLLTTKMLEFNWNGNHPMWDKDVFNNVANIESSIRNIPYSDRNIFVSASNGLKNQPLYYFFCTFFYKITSYGSIFERLYAVRLVSVIFALIAVYISYKIAFLVTAKKNLSITVASLISLNPSFTNITSTVTNDSMAIATVSLSIYLILDAAYKKTFISDIKSLAGGFLALMTRVHLGILLFYSTALFLFRTIKKKIFLFTIPLIILFFTASQKMPYYPFRLDKFVIEAGAIRNTVISPTFITNLILFLKSAIPHYLNEVFPWYFGVFGWLEVTLPPLVYTIIKLLILLSFLGFIVKRKNPYPRITPAVISAILLFLVIFIFDFLTFVQNGIGAGVQGRHFIPAIAVHTLLLLIGLELLTPKKFHNILRKILILFMASVNFIGLYLIINYFYNFNFDWIYFFKPSFVNPQTFLVISIIYIFLLLHFFYSVGRLKEDE